MKNNAQHKWTVLTALMAGLLITSCGGSPIDSDQNPKLQTPNYIKIVSPELYVSVDGYTGEQIYTLDRTAGQPLVVVVEWDRVPNDITISEWYEQSNIDLRARNYTYIHDLLEIDPGSIGFELVYEEGAPQTNENIRTVRLTLDFGSVPALGDISFYFDLWMEEIPGRPEEHFEVLVLLD